MTDFNAWSDNEAKWADQFPVEPDAGTERSEVPVEEQRQQHWDTIKSLLQELGDLHAAEDSYQRTANHEDDNYPSDYGDDAAYDGIVEHNDLVEDEYTDEWDAEWDEDPFDDWFFQFYDDDDQDMYGGEYDEGHDDHP